MTDVKITTSLDGVNQVKAGLSSMGDHAKTIGKAMATAFAGIGFGALIKNAIDAGDQIQKLSQKLGASTEALSQYKHVAGLAGVSLEQLAMGWQFMSRSISEASLGTGTAVDALDELGLSAKKLKALAPEHQFEVIADALDEVKNASDKTRLASDLFGARQTALLQVIEGGSEVLREGREEANSYGMTLSRVAVDNMAAFNDGLERVKNAGLGVVNMIAVQMGPALQAIGEFLGSVLPKSTKFFVDAIDGMRIIGLHAISAIAWGFAEFLELIGKLPGDVGKAAREASQYWKAIQTNVTDLAHDYTVATMEVEEFKIEQGAAIGTMKLATGETNKASEAIKQNTKETQEATKKSDEYAHAMELVRQAEEENNQAKDRAIQAYKEMLEPMGMTIDAHGEIVDILKKEQPIIHDTETQMAQLNDEYSAGARKVSEWGGIFRQEHHTVYGVVSSVVWDMKSAWHSFFGAVIAEGSSFKSAVSALWQDIKGIILRKLAEIVADALWNQLAAMISGKASQLSSLGSLASSVLSKITQAGNAAATLPTGGSAGGSGGGFTTGGGVGGAVTGAVIGGTIGAVVPGGNQGRNTGSTVGGAIGGAVGGPVGAVVGSFIGGAIGGIVGRGDSGPTMPRMQVNLTGAGWQFSDVSGGDFGAAGTTTMELAKHEIVAMNNAKLFYDTAVKAMGGGKVATDSLRNTFRVQVISQTKDGVVIQTKRALNRQAAEWLDNMRNATDGDGSNYLSESEFSALSGIVNRGFATGGQAVFSRPSLISVAENGPEMISAKPLASGASGGGGGVTFNGPVFFDELSLNRFYRGTMSGLERAGARY